MWTSFVSNIMDGFDTANPFLRQRKDLDGWKYDQPLLYDSLRPLTLPHAGPSLSLKGRGHSSPPSPLARESRDKGPAGTKWSQLP